jgi:sulfopyruvate decarboxylase alpha subunit
VFRAIKARDIATVCTVPDGGLTNLLNLIEADGKIGLVTLSTEEEGIGVATGCWLGGQRAMIAMQSSGVGNCINALGLPLAYRAPCLMLITMRGQWGEFNPWQVPMAAATQQAFELMDIRVQRVDHPAEVRQTVTAAAQMAFSGGTPTAVLLSQRLIGAKVFVK